jgi:hypothetical protein
MHNGITSIGANAFRGTKITEISLSNQLTTIQAGAFQDAVGLESLSIPSSVVTIGTGIITGTTSLEELTLHIESLPSLTRFLRFLYGGTSATVGGTLPTGLKTVTLESTTVTLLTAGFFQNFNTIQTINLSDTFTSMETDVFNGTTLLESVKLPKDITSLPNNTFLGSGLITFTVPTPVTLIGNSVFQNALRLTTVVVPGTVTSIGTNFLTGTTALQTLTLPIDAVPAGASQHLGYIFGLAQTTGVRPTALKTVTLNSNVQSILPVSYFHLFGSIETINLDAKFNNIQNSAFFGTTSLENIVLPVGLTTLGTNVFQNSGLKTVVIPTGITTIPSDTFNGASRLTTVTLHNGITTIGINAFANSGITTITLPNALVSIGNNAFLNATELTSLVIPDSVTTTGLGTTVLQGTTKLQTLTLNIDSLPALRRDLRYLFGGSSAILGGVMPNELKTVNLNSTTVTALTASFFRDFTSIETINLSNTFTTFSVSVFFGASSLKNLVLPNALTSIGNDSFSGAVALTKVIIPQTVTSLGGNAFRSMNQNVEIYFEGALPTFTLTASFGNLFGTNTGVKVYVLQENLEAFKTVPAFNELFTLDRLLIFTPGE